MADIRSMSAYYSRLAHEVIEEHEELEAVKGVTIIYLASEAAKKKGDKMVLGQCEKVADKWKWGIPCDFTITLFTPNVEGMTEDQLKILLFHELLHVGIDPEDGKLFVKPHDLEDFKAVIDAYGTDWASVG